MVNAKSKINQIKKKKLYEETIRKSFYENIIIFEEKKQDGHRHKER